MKPANRRKLLKITAMLCLTAAGAAHAQPTFPSKQITIIVPYTAGGTTDLLARSVAEVLRKATGQNVVVDNKPGAGGSIGGKQVIAAQPDGHTLLMTSSGINSVTPVVYKDFKPVEGLTQISVLVDVPFVVVVNKDFAAQNLKDFIAYAKKHPGEVKVGNASLGSHGHLSQILFEKAADIDLLGVPYKGSVPALNDMLGGHIQAVIDNVGVQKPFIDSAKVQPLFITSKQRSLALPNVPTSTELGLVFESVAWFGLAAPAKTPPEVVKAIRDMVAKGFQDKEEQDKLVKAGLTPVFGTPQEAAARTLSETRTLGSLAATLNLAQN